MASRHRKMNIAPGRARRVGLEVGDSAVRIAEISVTGNRVKLTVDGQELEGDMVPAPADGRKEVEVEAVLG